MKYTFFSLHPHILPQVYPQDLPQVHPHVLPQVYPLINLLAPPGWPLLVGFTIECSRRALIEYRKEKRIKNETEMIKEIKKSLT